MGRQRRLKDAAVDSDNALGSFYLTLCIASLFDTGNRFGF
jgi:hypothetical protein